LLKDIGFESMELDKIFQLSDDEKAGEDDIPETPKKPVSKTGDIYELGKHRIMAGDSTKQEDVEKLMNGKKADMVFTDPPYAVNYGADQDVLNKKSGGKSKLTVRPIIGDGLSTEECAQKIWKPSFKNLYESAKDDCSFYMTMCQGGDQMMMMMMSENWQIKHELIWVKNFPVFSMGRLDYDYQHEPILFGWKKKHNWYGKGQFLKSIWEIPKPTKSDLHPTMKPIELIKNAILNSSKRGDLVIDFFGGSGSTLIACEQTSRICYGMEIDPVYVDVIVTRWCKFTGITDIKKNGKRTRWFKSE
jgi:site-specific DNA-methyltransferase (adenine-specific)